MRFQSVRLVAVAFALITAVPTAAASFADLATRSLAAPVVVRATAVKSERLGARDAPGLAAGMARYLVTAATVTAIAAPSSLPPRLSYLLDLPLDARGKPAKLGARDVLLFLRPGNAPGQFALVDAHAETAWSAGDEAAARAVLIDARSGKVPVVTGVASAFRVPGGVPGEAESQFFLATEGGKPVSLVVLTRPGMPRRLSVALGDVIDEAAGGVTPATLLWFRLACGLPERLPATIDADAETASDWNFVRTSLGPCERTI